MIFSAEAQGEVWAGPSHTRECAVQRLPVRGVKRLPPRKGKRVEKSGEGLQGSLRGPSLNGFVLHKNVRPQGKGAGGPHGEPGLRSAGSVFLLHPAVLEPDSGDGRRRCKYHGAVHLKRVKMRVVCYVYVTTVVHFIKRKCRGKDLSETARWPGH